MICQLVYKNSVLLGYMCRINEIRHNATLSMGGIRVLQSIMDNSAIKSPVLIYLYIHFVCGTTDIKQVKPIISLRFYPWPNSSLLVDGLLFCHSYS